MKVERMKMDELNKKRQQLADDLGGYYENGDWIFPKGTYGRVALLKYYFSSVTPMLEDDLIICH